MAEGLADGAVSRGDGGKRIGGIAASGLKRLGMAVILANLLVDGFIGVRLASDYRAGLAGRTALAAWCDEAWAMGCLGGAFLLGSIAGSAGFLHGLRARRASEEGYRRLHESLRDAFLKVDLAGRIQDWNEAFQQMVGYSEQELRALTFRDITPEKWHGEGARIIREQVIGQGRSDVYEKEYVRRDGSVFPVEIRSFLLRDDLGQPEAIWAIVRDITERKQADSALRRSEERYRALFEHMRTGFTLREIVTDEAGKVVDCRFLAANQAFLDNRGFRREQVIGRTLTEIYPETPLEPVDWIALCAEVARTGQEIQFETWGRATQSWFEVTAYRAGPGQVAVLFGDITARKRAENELRLAANVFTHAGEGIMITDAAGTILDVNDSFSRITGYRRDETVGRNARLLKSGRHPAEFYDSMWRILCEKGDWRGEIWNRRKDGEIYPEMLTITAARDADGRIGNFVGIFHDISLVKEQQLRLEHTAYHDPLTNLPNRMLLADRLQQAVAHIQRRGGCLAVAYIDLDGFKQINDLHGHAAGDELLVVLSHEMKTVLRKGDTLARVGGDEFVAVFTELDRQSDLQPLLERLLKAAASPVRVGGVVLQTSASIGAALYPGDAADVETLVRRADEAMYLVKRSGRNGMALCEGAADSEG